MTKKIKIPSHFNPHAVVAWIYMGETVKKCQGKAAQDYEFMCLLRELHDAYPDEYEFYLAVERGEL